MDTNNDIINYSVSGIDFIIKKNNDYYVICTNSKIDWLDNINFYSINKKPSLFFNIVEISYSVWLV
jgi:hypothetical protein